MHPNQIQPSLAELEIILTEKWAAFYSKQQALIFRGTDVRMWLQGQITQDVRTAEMWRGNWCKATGQLQGITSGAFFADGSCVVWGDAKSLEIAFERSQKMVILEDVTAETIEIECLQIAGNNMKPTCEWQEIFASAIVFENHTISPGSLEVILVTANPNTLLNLYISNITEDPIHTSFDIESYRIGTQTPSYLDIEEKTLPPEFGAAFEGQTIHYDKGCYMGQEVLMRMHSRGHANRLWHSWKWETPVTPGDEIHDSEGKKLGSVTSVSESPNWGFLSGGMLHRTADPSLEYRTQNGVKGKIWAMEKPAF